VATFLGRVNVLPGTSLGQGRYRVGEVELDLGVDGFRAGDAVRIFLRPEDRHVEGDLAAMPNHLSGPVGHIDYLGTFCLAEVECSGLGKPMVVSLSLNQLNDLRVREGAPLAFALRLDRVRIFPA
jgi:iron(III) transport system ATP-binding protein